MEATTHHIKSADDLIEIFPELDKDAKAYKRIDKVVKQLNDLRVKMWDVNDEGEYLYFGSNSKRPYACQMHLEGKQLAFCRIDVYTTMFPKGEIEHGPNVAWVNIDYDNHCGGVGSGDDYVKHYHAKVIERKKVNWLHIGQLISKFFKNTDFFDILDIKRCTKCNGKGKILGYSHVHGGDCFRCGATGIDPYQN